MAIDSGVAGAMAALVGASVFSTGFLSTRIHQAQSDATRRAQEIDDRLLEEQQATLPSEAIRQEWEDLHQAVEDQLPRLVLRANYLIAAGVIALAAVAAAAADVGFDDGPELATTLAFVAVEILVVAVGVLDYRRARARLEARLARTRFERLREGERLLARGAWDRSTDRIGTLTAAEEIANELLSRTGTRWSEALGFDAMIRLARLYDPHTDRLHSALRISSSLDQKSAERLPEETRELLGSARDGFDESDRMREDLEREHELDADFERLTAQDPEHRRWWMAWARLAEEQERWDRAATRYLKGLEAGLGSAAMRKVIKRLEEDRQEFWLLPRKKPETLLAAMEELAQADGLTDVLAHMVASDLVRFAADPNSERRQGVATWIERRTEELVDESALGWIDAASFLELCEKYGRDAPEVMQLIGRLRQDLVEPAERAYRTSHGG